MGNKSKDHGRPQMHMPTSIARRQAEVLSRITGAYVNPDLDRRIEEIKKGIKDLEKIHGGLRAKLREVEAQMLKALGGLEVLEDMKKADSPAGGAKPSDAHKTPPPSSPPDSPATPLHAVGSGLPSGNSVEAGAPDDGGSNGDPEVEAVEGADDDSPAGTSGDSEASDNYPSDPDSPAGEVDSGN